MSLSQIRIANVRNIREAVVYPGPNLNIILGDNGSGKSSLLESIYLLGRAGSFRTSRNSEIINTEAKQLSVSGTLKISTNFENRIGISIENKKKTIKINGTEVFSRVKLLEFFPLQVVTPLSYLLIEGSPTIRRQFMDWGVFHIEQGYPEEWKRFKRCLNQRNSTLKIGKRSDKDVWDSEFAKYGTIVAHRRREYLVQLLPYIQNIGDQMLPSKTFEFEYFPGWELKQDLYIMLKQDFQRDLKFGFTHSGPHKSDLLLKINGRPCKSYLSRGQVKLLVLVMKLAQIKMLIDQRDSFGSLLIDDFCAELDTKNSNSLKQFLSDLDLQCFLTAMNRNSVGTLCGINSTLFHVEQGRVQAI